MNVRKWAGLVSNASPYILPSGACVAQDNLHCRTPGQVTARGGMRLIAFDVGSPNDAVDLYPILDAGACKLVTLSSNGEVVVLEGPDMAAAPATPAEPTLAPGPGQVVSSYTGRFYDANGEPPA